MIDSAPLIFPSYEITVPKISQYMSANDQLNRWERAECVKVWRWAGFLAAMNNVAVPKGKVLELVRITATVHIADNLRRDTSNFFPTFKAIIDGFVEAGVLHDDSDLHVIGPDPRRGYGSVPCIVFNLQEMTSR